MIYFENYNKKFLTFNFWLLFKLYLILENFYFPFLDCILENDTLKENSEISGSSTLFSNTQGKTHFQGCTSQSFPDFFLPNSISLALPQQEKNATYFHSTVYVSIYVNER